MTEQNIIIWLINKGVRRQRRKGAKMRVKVKQTGEKEDNYYKTRK